MIIIRIIIIITIIIRRIIVQKIEMLLPKQAYNLEQNKMEQQTPIPQINDEAAQKPKRAIFPNLISEGRGGVKFPIHFVQDCSSVKINVACSRTGV